MPGGTEKKKRERAPDKTLRRLADAFNNASLAHVCVDVQDYYCDKAHRGLQNRIALNLGSDRYLVKAVRMARNIREFAKAAGNRVPAFWVVHDIEAAYAENPALASLPLPERTNAMRRKLFRQEPRPDDEVILKKSFNGFANTGLEARLRRKNVKAILLSGVYFSQCVEDTALAARKKGFDVYIAKSMTSDLDFHRAVTAGAVERMKRAGIRFVSGKGVLGIVNG